MKHSIQKLENKNMQLKLELDKTEWDALVEESYNKNKGKYKVEGFRSGKAPRKMIEKMYGPHIFFEDAIIEGFNKHYTEILDNDKTIDLSTAQILVWRNLTTRGSQLLPKSQLDQK